MHTSHNSRWGRRGAAAVVVLAALYATCLGASAMAASAGLPKNVRPTWGSKAAPYASATAVSNGDTPGYWVFVCKSAKEAGYTGDLNKAFTPRVIDFDKSFPDGEEGAAVTEYPDPKRYEIDKTKPSLPIKVLNAKVNGQPTPDLEKFFNVWDNCNSSDPDPSFGVKRRPNELGALARYDYNRDGLAQGNIGAGWSFNFNPNYGLEVERLYVDDDIRAYRTSQASNPSAPPWLSTWGVSRSRLGGESHGERSGDQIRVCRGSGQWADGRHGNSWWKDISSGAESSGGGYHDVNYSTSVYGSYGAPNYRGPDSDGLYGDYSGMMSGTDGTHADPDARCHIAFDGTAAGSGREWYWAPAKDGIHSVNIEVSCATSAPNADYRCRSRNTTGSWIEGPMARANALNHGVSLTARGVRLFINDYDNPTLKITGGTLNRNGANATDGTSKLEDLTFDLKDNSGIRRMEIRVTKPGGAVVRIRNVENRTADGELCDYRFPIPCAGATATNQSRPAWASGVEQAMLDPVKLNADDLPNGTYTVTIQAWDAANRTSSASARFSVNSQLVTNCRGDEIRTTATRENCGSANPVCTGAGCLPTDRPSNDPIPTGPWASPPKTGTGIFSYSLAYNPSANGLSPSGGGCTVIESVIGGSSPDSGGALNDREKNQIISVTLDFSGFSSLGQSLGTQDLRSTFDLPARRDSRYRSALGCPG